MDDATLQESIRKVRIIVDGLREGAEGEMEAMARRHRLQAEADEKAKVAAAAGAQPVRAHYDVLLKGYSTSFDDAEAELAYLLDYQSANKSLTPEQIAERDEITAEFIQVTADFFEICLDP